MNSEIALGLVTVCFLYLYLVSLRADARAKEYRERTPRREKPEDEIRREYNGDICVRCGGKTERLICPDCHEKMGYARPPDTPPRLRDD